MGDAAQDVVTGRPPVRPPRRGGAARSAKPAGRPASEPVDLGDLGGLVSFHLRLAQDASARALARHRDDALKPACFPALAIIHLNPGISQSALGRALLRDKSTVSPLIRDLQRSGFISRAPSARDRRGVTLALTEKGERTLEDLRARAAEHEGELVRLIGPARSQFVATLATIAAGLRGDPSREKG